MTDIRRLSFRFKNLVVIWPRDQVDSYALMLSCEKTITFGSTMGYEATYWGKPSISANSGAYDNFGCTYNPNTHDELVSLLRADLAPLPAICALQYAYRFISDGVSFEYFTETGFKNRLAVGKFDGVEIGPSKISSLWYAINLFFLRAKKGISNPSLVWRRLALLTGLVR